jgi:hypothetical protein
MGSRGVLEKFLFDGVPVEPRDGAQPPGDRVPGPAFGFEMAGEAFDIGAANCEQWHRAAAAPGGELAQIQRVSLASQAAVPSQEPGKGKPFGVGEDGLDHDEGSGRGSSGHRAPPGRA